MRAKVSLLIVLSFLITSQAKLLSQTEALDSLNRALSFAVDSKEKISIINRTAYELRDNDPEKSMQLIEKALGLARNSNEQEEIAFALNTKGYLFENRDEYLTALIQYQEALQIFIDIDNEENVAHHHYLIGSIYKTIGNYEKATEHCLEGLKIYEKLGDDKGIELIYRVMGSIYKYKGDYEKSLFYYFHGLEINERTGNLPRQAISNNNIGIVYRLMNDSEAALRYYRKSLIANQSLNIESEAAINCGNIGVVFLDINQLDSALLYITKRYEYALLLGDKKGISSSKQSFGNYYLKRGDYPQALKHFKEALQYSRDIGILETAKNSLRSLSELYQHTGDYSNALKYYKDYIELRDSILNKESVQRIEQLEHEYISEKEEELRNINDQKRKLYGIIGFAALALTIFLLFLIFMNQRIKLKRRVLQQRNLEIDKQQLQYAVHHKDNKLIFKAINLAEKNQFISELSLRLNKVLYDSKDWTKEIKEILKDLKFHADSQAWEEFEMTFLQVHPDFFNTLEKKIPNLSPNDKRLSALLRLNLSTKEISNITHQSLHSLTVARTRLRKKLGIANTDENLASFLSQF